jgi:ADP-ribose pyrophosphatase YjhB (NUDIX family)
MADEIITYCSAGGIVIDGDQVLLVRKKRVPEVRLPKGHVEPGEGRQAAALRETAEETGYAELRPLADLGLLTVTFMRQSTKVVRIESFFLMALAGPGRAPRSAEDEEKFEPFWAPLDQAEGMLTFPSEQEFLRRARVAAAVKS